ncbi:PilZ domain-containing protein [Sporosarcina thermotolerans]|uniref:PilZ domain-containing protein n=1 Tax=Sporosarcina thermotolerans TaxID=633404 RepID=A0AAW9A8L6_9BACL|nr:PilZ domain-containing protein [Sporosarcina thermotolerans]MDW0116978.1 PilZ domain-containing protein [Sporosarcina thermotolerans]WHT47909.1 PilZ domain-containing protein [Sporosarcina thermotolerans]
MQYKRHEYFRHTFDNPLSATFRILVEGSSNESNPGNCMLLDISTGGTKLISSLDIPTDTGPVRLRLNFVIYEANINVIGEIVWKRRGIDGIRYGIKFIEDASTEKLILDELKLRRRTEIGAAIEKRGENPPTR